jgi:hypothetical protein
MVSDIIYQVRKEMELDFGYNPSRVNKDERVENIVDANG